MFPIYIVGRHEASSAPAVLVEQGQACFSVMDSHLFDTAFGYTADGFWNDPSIAEKFSAAWNTMQNGHWELFEAQTLRIERHIEEFLSDLKYLREEGKREQLKGSRAAKLARSSAESSNPECQSCSN